MSAGGIVDKKRSFSDAFVGGGIYTVSVDIIDGPIYAPSSPPRAKRQKVVDIYDDYLEEAPLPPPAPPRAPYMPPPPRMSKEEYMAFLASPPPITVTRTLEQVYKWFDAIEGHDPWQERKYYITPYHASHDYAFRFPSIYFVCPEEREARRGVQYVHRACFSDKDCLARVQLARLYPNRQKFPNVPKLIQWADNVSRSANPNDYPGIENLADEFDRLIGLGFLCVVDKHAAMLFDNDNDQLLASTAFSKLIFTIADESDGGDNARPTDVDPDVLRTTEQNGGRIHWFTNRRTKFPVAFKVVHETRELAKVWTDWLTATIGALSVSVRSTQTDFDNDVRLIRNRLITWHQNACSSCGPHFFYEGLRVLLQSQLEFSQRHMAKCQLQQQQGSFANWKGYIYHKRCSAVLLAYLKKMENERTPANFVGRWTQCNTATTLKTNGLVWRRSNSKK